MPKQRMCSTCQNRHNAPTGKHCTRGEATGDDIEAKVDRILETLGTMTTRIIALEDEKTRTPESQLSASDDDPDIATATSLQKNKTLTSKLRERLAQLRLGDTTDESEEEQCKSTTKKGKKSGRARTVQDIVVKDIDWPHFYVYRGSDRKPASYEDLSIPEFVYGYTTQMTEEKDGTIKEKMAVHLNMLMRDAIDFTWQNVRNFHGVFLAHLEMKRLTWHEDASIQNLRASYVLNVPHGTTPQRNDRDASEKRYMCTTYQDRKCAHDQGHKTARGFQHHACAHCFQATGHTYPHPARVQAEVARSCYEGICELFDKNMPKTFARWQHLMIS